MKVNKTELTKPIVKKKDGSFATLKEVLEGNILLKEEMDSQDYKDLSIARYQMMDQNKAIAVGSESYTKEKIVKEIDADSEKGKLFVNMQTRFVKMILDRKEEIETE
jgi:hypothetical protein